MSLKIEKLSKKWENFSIKNVNLEIEEGEYFVILGPTGAGKTLLLELIAGFYKPDSGRILLDGKDITMLSPEKRKIGYVPQNYMLFPHMTVEENIEFGLKMQNVPIVERLKTVEWVLKLLGLTQLRKRLPETLSGGEKQKTALARALVIKPKILLLDEPLSALDINTQKKLRNELKALHEKLRITTIYVTHNQFEAYYLAEKIAIMNEGTIVQAGSPEEVFKKPKNDFIARFIGFENLFEGKILSNNNGIAIIDVCGIKFEAITSKVGKCIVGIRPDDIIVSLHPLNSSIRNVLKGKISDFIDMGSLVNLIVKVNELSFIALITKRSFIDMKLDRGKDVYIAFKASSIHVI